MGLGVLLQYILSIQFSICKQIDKIATIWYTGCTFIFSREYLIQ